MHRITMGTGGMGGGGYALRWKAGGGIGARAVSISSKFGSLGRLRPFDGGSRRARTERKIVGWVELFTRPNTGRLRGCKALGLAIWSSTQTTHLVRNSTQATIGARMIATERRDRLRDDALQLSSEDIKTFDEQGSGFVPSCCSEAQSA